MCTEVLKQVFSKKMAVVYCSVDGCMTRRGTGLSMFSCPLDEARCQLWKTQLGFVGNHKYANITPKQSHNRITICRLHFTENSFANPWKQRLTYNAVPSLLLPTSQDNPSTGVSARLSIKTVDACIQTDSWILKESTDLPTEHPSTSSEHPPAADESVLIDHIKKEEEYDDIFDETVDDVLQVTKEELMDIVNQSETGSDVDDRFTEVSPKKEPIYSDQEGDSEPPSKKRKSKDDETRPPLNDKAGPSHRSSLDRELRQESINLVQTIQQDPELAEMLDSSGNIDLFFESILALAKTLSPLDQVILQRNIANVIFGMKITQLMRKK